MAEEDKTEKKLTTLEIVVLVVTFLGFVGTVINVCFAVIDHTNLKLVKTRLLA